MENKINFIMDALELEYIQRNKTIDNESKYKLFDYAIAKELEEKYLKAKKELQDITEHKNNTKEKILIEHIFVDENNNRVTTSTEDYTITEFEKYCKLCYNEYLKIGIAGKNWDDCIDWQYKKNLIMIENELLKFIIETLPENDFTEDKKKILIDSTQYNIRNRQKMIDTFLQLKK